MSLSHVVLGSRLEIQRGHVIEEKTDASAENAPCMRDADFLHQLHLAVVELVHVAVDATRTPDLLVPNEVR